MISWGVYIMGVYDILGYIYIYTTINMIFGVVQNGNEQFLIGIFWMRKDETFWIPGF